MKILCCVSLGTALLGGASIPVMADDFVVANGVVDQQRKKLSGTDTLTIQQGGRLSYEKKAIEWDGASGGAGVVIDNAGIIEATGSEERAIDTDGPTSPRNLTLINRDGALIQSEGDAFRIDNDITEGLVEIRNFGTIRSTIGGQALDFDSIRSAGSANSRVRIYNEESGIIEALNSDAIRTGNGTELFNAGLINAEALPGDTKDAVDLQQSDATITNMATGVITGQRHGITTDVDVTVYNYGTITGRNGSGVGSDGNGTVYNYGTILGEYDGHGTGDGDGVDIDNVGYVENWGRIAGTGAGGVKDDGVNRHQSEGIAITSHATIINHIGGVIEAPAAAISSIGFASITNHGIIRSPNHAYGTYGRSVIVNTGTMEGGANEAIISYFNADDVLTNSGTLIGGNGYAARLGGGDDLVTLQGGSRIVGLVDGGTGLDTLNLEQGIAFDVAGVVNFERLSANDGAATVFGTGVFDLTSIAAGSTLYWGDGGDDSPVTGMVSNEGTFVFNRADDLSFGDVISGSGTIVKAQDNQVTLTADSSAFSGETRVEGGSLLVNGNLGGQVSVLSGASLSGNGWIGSLVVDAGGRLTASNPSQDLNVGGNAVFNDGAIYRVALGSGGGSLSVAGAVTIQDGAVLQFTNQVPGTGQILMEAAGGFAGEFEVSNGSPFFDTQLTYSSDALLADVSKIQAFSAAATTQSQYAVANAIDGMDPSSALAGAFSGVSSLQEANSVIDTLAGDIHPSLQGAGIDGSARLRNVLGHRMSTVLAPDPGPVPVLGYGPGGPSFATDPRNSAIWTQMTGVWSRREGNGAKFTSKSAGVLLGAHSMFADDFYAGVATGYERATVESGVNATSGEIGSTQIAVYGGTRIGQATFSGGASYALHMIDTKRQVTTGGLNETLSADYDGYTTQVFAEGAYDISLGENSFQPFLNLAYMRSGTDAFVETGGVAALTGQATTNDVFVTTIGSRFSRDVVFNGTSGRLFGALAWQHAFNDSVPGTALNFAGSGQFTVQGAPTVVDEALIEMGIELDLNAMGLVSLAYSGSIASSADRHAGELAWSKAF